MTAPSIGIINQTLANDIIAASPLDFSKLLAIDVSTDADATMFPLLTPVRFSTSDDTFMSKIGTGPLAQALKLAQAQLLVSGVDVTVIRVAAGTDQPTTATNIIAGIAVAMTVPVHVNATPRLVHLGTTDWMVDSTHANPVCVAAIPLLNALRAFSVVQAPSDTSAHALAWRQLIDSQRIHGIAIEVQVWDEVNSVYVNQNAAPAILGLGMRVDQAMGGYPFDTWCNLPIYGIGGLSRPIAYSLEDGSTEGQVLLAADLGIIVAGEIGVDQAIADGGFTYLGVSSCGDDTDYYTQYHQLRSLDYVTVEAMKITREILGRRATPSKVETWILSLRNMVADHVINNRLLGGAVDFPIANPNAVAAVLQTLTGQSDGVNTVDSFRNGNLLGSISIEPAPAIKVVTNQFKRYEQAVELALAAILTAVSQS